MGASRNARKLERFAQELALMKSPVEASRAAGYPAGTSFNSNARKRACRADVKARVAELQGKEAELVGVDSAWVQRRLKEIAEVNLGKSKIKVSDQIASLNLLAKMIGAFAPEKIDLGFGGLGNKLDAALQRSSD